MSTANANARAAVLVIVAMAAFCFNDTIIKTLSARVPIGELIAVRGLFAILLMIVVSRLTARSVPSDVRMKMLVLHAPEELGLKQEYIREHEAHGH